ncbi:MAG: homogentisate 1,2-dioxygenase [Alphaproteobacteria bacterium]
MTRGIPLAKSEGTASRQAHADLPEGTYEREVGRDGFFGPATQFHHRRKPTSWRRIEGPMRPRAFDAARAADEAASPFAGTPLLGNEHLEVRLWRAREAMPALARNADGDMLAFVHEGAGALYCDYGHLDYREGDYVLLPRGTAWRIEPSEPSTFLLIEASGDLLSVPERGLLGQQAIFDLASLDTPRLDDAFRAQDGDRPWRIEVKRRGALSTIEYPHNPLDAVGWHGTLMPVRLNWRDIRPVLSDRMHLPPSVHATFACRQFVVCTFAPRPLEGDPGALKVPFFHDNVDYDEMIFYHRGSFFSRDNIAPGWITVHPCGVTHGPHPKAFAAGAKRSRANTDEVAVMIDSRAPIEIGPLPQGAEWEDYALSWREGGA